MALLDQTGHGVVVESFDRQVVRKRMKAVCSNHFVEMVWHHSAQDRGLEKLQAVWPLTQVLETER